jgi:hypothetical protein
MHRLVHSAVIAVFVVTFSVMEAFHPGFTALAQEVSPAAADSVPSTVISIGTIASNFLSAVLATAAPIIAFYAVKIIAKLAEGVGLSVNDSMRDRLDDLAVNFLNKLDPAQKKLLAGKYEIDVGSQIAKQLIEYVALHGAEIVSKLGGKIGTPEFESAMVARANKVINDPAKPTPPEITPPSSQPVAAVVGAT